MFENAVLRSPRSRAPAVIIAYILQFILLGGLVLVPLLHVDALPRLLTTDTWFLPSAPPPPPPPGGISAARRSLLHKNLRAVLEEPAYIPPTIQNLQDEPPTPEVGPADALGVEGGVPGGTPGGVPEGVLRSVLSGTTPPPPPQSKPATMQRIRLGGNVIEAKLIYHPDPEYPPLARAAHVQGIVVLQAVIGKDGTIQELKVLRGHALLVNAARDAVARWRYQPTLLNGEPVEVLTEITVNFRLSE